MAFRKGNRIREIKALHYQGRELYLHPAMRNAPCNIKAAVKAHKYLWKESGWLLASEKNCIESLAATCG